MSNKEWQHKIPFFTYYSIRYLIGYLYKIHILVDLLD
jgi:hypothetical protein